MATYTDNLDGTAGTLLSARSGVTRTVGVDDITLTTGGSGYYMTDGAIGSNGTWHKFDNQPAGNDQYVEAFLQRGSGGNPFPLCVRADTSSANGAGYISGMDTTTRIRLLRRIASGQMVALGSYTHGNATDQATNKARLEVVGTTLTVSFMGSVVIGPITDANISSGSVAILTRGGTATTTTATVDDIAWGDAGAVAITGAGAGTFDITGSASGSLAIRGAGAGTFDITGTATGAAGVVPIVGAGSGVFSITGSATGSLANRGNGAGVFEITGTGAGNSGVPAITGEGAGVFDITGSATGSLANRGVGGGVFTIGGAGAGTLSIRGAGSGLFLIGGTATGASGLESLLRAPTASRPVLSQGASRPRQYSTARPRAASSW